MERASLTHKRPPPKKRATIPACSMGCVEPTTCGLATCRAMATSMARSRRMRRLFAVGRCPGCSSASVAPCTSWVVPPRPSSSTSAIARKTRTPTRLACRASTNTPSRPRRMSRPPPSEPPRRLLRPLQTAAGMPTPARLASAATPGRLLRGIAGRRSASSRRHRLLRRRVHRRATLLQQPPRRGGLRRGHRPRSRAGSGQGCGLGSVSAAACCFWAAHLGSPLRPALLSFAA